jgi:hypothetical protein
MSLTSSMKQIQAALDASSGCSAGLTGQKMVFGIDRGPSGGPEILAVLYLDDPTFGFWYGHILRHPQKPGVFVALIVWASKFINATNVPLLFRRFHYWIAVRLQHRDCLVQNPDDAYAESRSLDSAASALIQMIYRFDIDKRIGWEDSPYEFDHAESRSIDVYGWGDIENPNSTFPPVPMPTELRLVGAPE